jgi:hypothetical protein
MFHENTEFLRILLIGLEISGLKIFADRVGPELEKMGSDRIGSLISNLPILKNYPIRSHIRSDQKFFGKNVIGSEAHFKIP